MRTLILGNSGSGKTWLASRLASRNSLGVTHLDQIFWQPGGFDQPRPNAEADALVAEQLQKSDWVVEGIFGKLASQFLPAAEILIWLDLPWETCRLRLLARGSESKRHMDRSQSDAGLQQLLVWAENYYTRQSSSSYAGHLDLYASFNGQRYRLTSQDAVVAYFGGNSHKDV